jgi:hypothetical protein
MSLPDDHAEVLRRQEHEIPIRFGSPLFSKLQKRYWELAHVKGLPLVFAIADFHDDQSMMWTSTALINYLYGVRHEFHFDEHGQLVITAIKIETHRVDHKEIPSGFFFQPEENMSVRCCSRRAARSRNSTGWAGRPASRHRAWSWSARVHITITIRTRTCPDPSCTL